MDANEFAGRDHEKNRGGVAQVISNYLELSHTKPDYVN